MAGEYGGLDQEVLIIPSGYLDNALKCKAKAPNLESYP